MLAAGRERCENGASVSVEHELVAAALEGDGRAFGELVRPHLPALYRIAARACRSGSLAEDVVQETLTVAYEQLGKYQPGTSLKSYLASIAVKRAHTLMRGEARRRTREDNSDVPVGEASPAELVSAAHTAERVQEALAQMPEKRRAAALLRLDGGLSYAEIAAAVDTTEGSARVLVHLAMKELREKLADLVEHRPRTEDAP